MKSTVDNKGKIFTEVVQKRPVDVHIQTSKNLIRGRFHVNLNHRIKDELDKSGRFIALTDAEICDLKGTFMYNCNFLTINRHDINWLFQDKDLKDKADLKDNDEDLKNEEEES
jgi:hypothetical protein